MAAAEAHHDHPSCLAPAGELQFELRKLLHTLGRVPFVIRASQRLGSHV
jgi:hypothetical protein